MDHLTHPLEFHLDDSGLDAFAPGFLKPAGEARADHHLSAADVLGLFDGPDSAVEEAGPTSSSSEGSGRSSGRNSETTHPLLAPGQGPAASWLHLAPQLAANGPVAAGAGGGGLPVLYAQQQQQQSAYQFTAAQHQQQSSRWHPAFPAAADARQQTTSKESKATVSHSTIEKQRRDRINSLIDELRDLVPPSASMKSPDGGDAKRPKHVVLSDTIALLRQLKDKVQQDELERQRLQMMQEQMSQQQLLQPMASGMVLTEPPAAGALHHLVPQAFSLPSAADCSLAGVSMGQSAQSLLQHSLSASYNSQTVAAAAAATLAGCPDLPQAPANLPSAVGVLVEEACPGSFLVKVNCKDRHGLLSDITQALCSLPLQIARAAITTSNGGAVYDVFEIIAEQTAAGHEPVTALDVQFHVHQALYRWKSAQPGAAGAAGAAPEGIAIGKRQRM